MLSKQVFATKYVIEISTFKAIYKCAESTNSSRPPSSITNDTKPSKESNFTSPMLLPYSICKTIDN